MTQWRTNKNICLVHIWVEITIRIYLYLGTTRAAPVNTVGVQRHKTAITSQMIYKSLSSGTLSFGKERLGFSHKEVRTKSLWLVFAMELFLVKFYQETIIIMLQWAINSLLRYIRIQFSNLRKGSSTRMKNKQVLYTISIADIV